MYKYQSRRQQSLPFSISPRLRECHDTTEDSSMKRSNSGAHPSSAAPAAVVAVSLLEGKATKDSVAAIPYADLVARKEDIQARLQVIGIEPIQTKKPTAASTGSSSNNNASGHAKKKSRSNKQSPSKISNNNNNNNNSSSDPILRVSIDQPQVPMIEKTSDVHWDFTMKEMMWLATDFQAERKRQMSLAKKLASAVHQYHKTRESRRQRGLAEAELKRRRLAAKLGRDVKGWWTKIERVIAYKQKCSADEERRQAMNKQLVTLVKQTEKYTESLIRLPNNAGDDGDDDDDDDDDDDWSSGDDSHSGDDSSQRNKQRRKRRRRRRRSTMTIEEALAVGERSRRSKTKVVDYNRLQLQKGEDDYLYGESTASDTGSDASFSLEDSDGWTDDETTLLEAEQLETKERQLRERNHSGRTSEGAASSSSASSASFTADPRELCILQEEGNLPIEEVLERYRTEMESTTLVELAGSGDDVNDTQMTDANAGDSAEEQQGDVNQLSQHPRRSTRRNVTFASGAAETNNGDTTTNPHPKPPSLAVVAAAAAAKYDADDDGDASDVEDFVDLLEAGQAHGDDDSDGAGSDEFEADQDEVDDETTMEQEERLPQQMSAKEEIDLLNQEQEMPVEELRRMYAGAFESSGAISSKGTEESQPATTTKALPTTTANNDAATAPMDIDDIDTESNGDSVDDDGSGSEEFEADQEEVDDETTMEQEERLPQQMTAQEEINLLKAENEMTVEELRKKYAGAFGAPSQDEDVSDDSVVKSETGRKTRSTRIANRSSRTTEPSELDLEQALGAGDDEGGEDEFVPTAGTDDVDDETTMEAEERLGRDVSYEEELKLLKDQNEIPVEQLRAMYASALNGDDHSSDNDDEGIEEEAPESDDDTRLSSKRGATGDSSLVNALLGSADLEDGGDEDDFEPEAGEEIDDETTMEAEERLGRDMSYADELALLNQENELSVDELRAKYAGAFVNGASSTAIGNEGEDQTESSSAISRLASSALMDDSGSDAGDDAEFVADAEEIDDETTMEAEERLGREMSPEAELAMLQEENDTPIESLYEMYQKMEQENQANASEAMDEDSSETGSASEPGAKRKRVSSLDRDNSTKRAKTDDESDDGLAAIEALEESAERARKTLASRPFLIAPWVKLRAYQQIGLNWLVSLQTRRLNGILADGKSENLWHLDDGSRTYDICSVSCFTCSFISLLNKST